jgi:hypothetical protein
MNSLLSANYSTANAMRHNFNEKFGVKFFLNSLTPLRPTFSSTQQGQEDWDAVFASAHPIHSGDYCIMS